MESIQEIVDQVTQELDENRRLVLINDFIEQVVQSQSGDSIDALIFNRISNIPDGLVKQEVKDWSKVGSFELALKMREATRIILRQELLGE